MKVHFDPETDAVYFRLDDSTIIESEEVKEKEMDEFDSLSHSKCGVQIPRGIHSEGAKKGAV